MTSIIESIKGFFAGLGDSTMLLDYPSKCEMCGFDGYESQVRKHVRLEHPELIELASEVMKRHKKGEIGLTEAKQIVKDAYDNEC